MAGFADQIAFRPNQFGFTPNLGLPDRSLPESVKPACGNSSRADDGDGWIRSAGNGCLIYVFTRYGLGDNGCDRWRLPLIKVQQWWGGYGDRPMVVVVVRLEWHDGNDGGLVLVLDWALFVDWRCLLASLLNFWAWIQTLGPCWAIVYFWVTWALSRTAHLVCLVYSG